MPRLVASLCLAVGLAVTAGTAEAATPTRTPTGAALIVDAAQVGARQSASSPTRRPASPTVARRAAQQAPPSLTATATRTLPSATPRATQTLVAAASTVTPSATRPPATETRRPSPSPSHTARATATAVEIPQLPRTHQAVRGWQEASLLVLDVPIRSQLDGSYFQSANCGPASLAMVLEAFDVEARTPLLRNYANLLQGSYGRDDGIALDHLAAIAEEAGLRPIGLRNQWSVGSVKAQLRLGHPTIALVKMRLLPDHAASATDTDHYIVVVGLDGDDLLVNDPARSGEQGFRRRLSPTQLEAAWAASSIPRHALAIGAAEGVPELQFGSVQPTVTVAEVAVAEVPVAVQQPAAVSQPTPIVIVITPVPAPAPVIVLNVPAMPQVHTVSLPMATPDRWARPGRIYAEQATPVPSAMSPRDEAVVVLGEANLPASDGVTRWLLRVTLIAAAGNLLRCLLR